MTGAERLAGAPYLSVRGLHHDRGYEHDFVDAFRVRIDLGKSGETDQAVIVQPSTLMPGHMQPCYCRNAAAMKMTPSILMGWVRDRQLARKVGIEPYPE